MTIRGSLLIGALVVSACVGAYAVEGTASNSTDAVKRVLLVTGQDYPGHKWKETAPVLARDLAKDARLDVTVTEDPKQLASADLGTYDVIVLHFQNWEQPDPGPEARANLQRCIDSGKGLVIVHFACGAFQEWPEFRNLAGRSYDPKLPPHDPFGAFRVDIANPDHAITKGLKPFEATDELYTCLAGDRPIDVLMTSKSKVDGKDYPMAFAFTYGKGRVFHSPLGHDAAAFNNPAVADLFRRGCAWAAGLDPAACPKRIALIAGAHSHGEGAHEHENGIRLLKKCLDNVPNIGPIKTDVAVNGWPEDMSMLDNADTIVIYADGYEGHPFFATPERQAKIQELMTRGIGLVCVHFAVSPARNEAAETTFAKWLGGYYKDGYSQNPINNVEVTPATPDHPVSRGLAPYTMEDEFYYQLKFDESGGKIAPILTAQLPKDAPKTETLAWAFDRKDGGRSFGFTGGHFHKNWNGEFFRKMVLNAIVWTAGIDVPPSGVESTAD